MIGIEHEPGAEEETFLNDWQMKAHTAINGMSPKRTLSFRREYAVTLVDVSNALRDAYVAGLEDAHAAMCTCSEGIRAGGCDCRAASILRRRDDEIL